MIKRPRKDKRKGVKRKHHNIPDEIDVEIKYQEYLKHSKGLDEDGRPKPLTENQLKQLIRSAVRKKWMSCSSKLAFLEKHRIPDTDPNSRRIWKWQCNHCKEFFGLDEVNVDHRYQEETFTELSQAFAWASSLLNAGGDEDLQVLCVPDHEVKSHCDSTGLSWEDAILDKILIKWEGDNKGVVNQRSLLVSYGVPNADKLKAKEIRKALFDFMKANPTFDLNK